MYTGSPEDSNESPQFSDIWQWTNESGVVRFRAFTHHNLSVQGETIPRGTVIQVYGKSVDSRWPKQWFTTYGERIVELPEIPEGSIEGALWSPLFLIERAGKTFTETKLLGKGGFGRVMRATHPYTRGTEYAKKIITQDVPDLEALRREIKGLTQFTDDPHIAEHITDGMDGDALTIIMLPIASRGSLADVLGELQKIPSDREDYGKKILEVLRWTYCLAKSLARVHDKGIVHGDIQPKNILVHHENIIYSDFGIASARATTTTSASMLKWKPTQHELTSPPATATPQRQESSATKNFSGPKGDAYALGWVLYEMVLAATLNPWSGNALPSYPHAKMMAWDNRDEFLQRVNTFSEDPCKLHQILGPNGEAFENFTKELLGIITSRMIVLQADDRADMKEIATRIRSVMDRPKVTPQICCDGSFGLLGKPW